DVVESSHYRNAQNTLEHLLKCGVIPIINENDTVVVEELCFGDNDKLSALVAGMVNANLLVLLTDVDGLFTCNPLKDSSAQLIEIVEDVSEVKNLADGKGSNLGTGGMITKLKAAEMATRFGITTYLMNASRIDEILKIPCGEAPHGTMFTPAKHKLAGKKRWIAYGALFMGSIVIDEGAQKALVEDGKSLLATGIIKLEGCWERKDLVRVINGYNEEIARGIVELSSEETDIVKGLHSDEMLACISDLKGEEVVHRDNMTIVYEGCS
ncbi:MAG: glutamate 5-kinase, partial [Eubacteriales bacterium]